MFKCSLDLKLKCDMFAETEIGDRLIDYLSEL